MNWFFHHHFIKSLFSCFHAQWNLVLCQPFARWDFHPIHTHLVIKQKRPKQNTYTHTHTHTIKTPKLKGFKKWGLFCCSKLSKFLQLFLLICCNFFATLAYTP
jgi:hypothetical protein